MPSSVDFGVHELQQAGVYDNGAPGGIMAVRGDNVMVPFRFGQFGAPGGSAIYEGGNPDNPDGSTSAVSIAVALGAPSVYLRFMVSGPVVGLRWQNGYSSGGSEPRDFSVMIEGRAYAAVNTILDPMTRVASGYTNAYGGTIFASELPDVPHLVDAVLPAPLVASFALYRLYGYIASRAAGYSDVPRVDGWSAPTAVPFTPAAFGVLPTGVNGRAGIRRLYYDNPTGGMITVLIQLSGGTTMRRDVPAAKTETIDFGAPVAVGDASYIKHQASATGLMCTVQNAY